MPSSRTAEAARRDAAVAADARTYNDWQFRELLVGRLERLGVLVAILLVGGTLGFVLTEDTSTWDGFTWTLDTIATVGSVPAPSSTGGQVVKAVLIVLGVRTLYDALVSATEFFVAGHVTGLLDVRRRQRMVDGISEHYLVCGFGRVGRQVARDLRAAGATHVVIDRNPQSLERAAAAGVPWLQGDAADEELLLRAGIERARALIACVDSDAENVFITLTARELRPDLTVVARASASEAEQKLRRAGAERVVSPCKSSGSEMTRLALRPRWRPSSTWRPSIGWRRSTSRTAPPAQVAG
jgi:voltage-gated potassium channel